MTGATYELTTPAQRQLYREDRARAERELAATVARVQQMTREMGAKAPTPTPARRSAS